MAVTVGSSGVASGTCVALNVRVSSVETVNISPMFGSPRRMWSPRLTLPSSEAPSALVSSTLSPLAIVAPLPMDVSSLYSGRSECDESTTASTAASATVASGTTVAVNKRSVSVETRYVAPPKRR